MSQGKGKRGNREVHCRSLRAGRRDIEMAPEDTAIKNDRAAAPSRKFTTFFSLDPVRFGRSEGPRSLVRAALPRFYFGGVFLIYAPTRAQDQLCSCSGSGREGVVGVSLPPKDKLQAQVENRLEENSSMRLHMLHPQKEGG
ncbi:unnamed protein product [Arctogadus glacialis]